MWRLTWLVLHQITANDVFDWFAPPTSDTMELHNQMLSIALPEATDGSFMAWYMRKPFFQVLIEKFDTSIELRLMRCPVF